MPGGSMHSRGGSQCSSSTKPQGGPHVQFCEGYDVRMKRRQGALPWQNPMTDAAMHNNHPYAQRRLAAQPAPRGYIARDNRNNNQNRNRNSSTGRSDDNQNNNNTSTTTSNSRDCTNDVSSRSRSRSRSRRRANTNTTIRSVRASSTSTGACNHRRRHASRPAPSGMGAGPSPHVRACCQHGSASRPCSTGSNTQRHQRMPASVVIQGKRKDASRNAGRAHPESAAPCRRHGPSSPPETIWCYVCMQDIPNSPCKFVRCCPSGTCTVCAHCLHVLLDFHDRQHSLHTIQCPGTCRQHVSLSYVLDAAAACVDDDTREYYATAQHKRPEPALAKCPTCLRGVRHGKQGYRATCPRCQCSFCIRHGMNKARNCRGCRPQKNQSRGTRLLAWLRGWRCSRCGSKERPVTKRAYFTCTCGSRICWHCGKPYQQGRHGRELFPTLARLRMQCNDKTLWAKRVAACVLGPPGALLLGVATVTAMPFYITYKLGYCLFDGCCCLKSTRQPSIPLDTPPALHSVI